MDFSPLLLPSSHRQWPEDSELSPRWAVSGGPCFGLSVYNTTSASVTVTGHTGVLRPPSALLCLSYFSVGSELGKKSI